MKAPLLAYIGLLEVDKAAFSSLVDVLGEIVRISFSSVKTPLITYIWLLEVEEAVFQSLVDVLRKKSLP